MVAKHRKQIKPSPRIKVHAVMREKPDFHQLAVALIELAEDELRKEDILKKTGGDGAKMG